MKTKYVLSIIIAVAVVLAAVFLPDILVQRQSDEIVTDSYGRSTNVTALITSSSDMTLGERLSLIAISEWFGINDETGKQLFGSAETVEADFFVELESVTDSGILPSDIYDFYEQADTRELSYVYFVNLAEDQQGHYYGKWISYDDSKYCCMRIDMESGKNFAFFMSGEIAEDMFDGSDINGDFAENWADYIGLDVADAPEVDETALLEGTVSYEYAFTVYDLSGNQTDDLIYIIEVGTDEAGVFIFNWYPKVLTAE